MNKPKTPKTGKSNKRHIQGAHGGAMHELLTTFGASVDFDRALWREDIAGSLAHAAMLQRQGLLSQRDLAAIKRGMRQIAEEIESGKFKWTGALEDVHMNIESRLIDLIGPAGQKLHTGRSRNDQVATDLRLWLRVRVHEQQVALCDLRGALLDLAEQNVETILPGYTHLQRAQPIPLAHWAHAYERQFARDTARLRDLMPRLNRLPLGSAALAGTPHPLDRKSVAADLGFDDLCENSLDAVSDRDFAVEYLSAAALCGLHLSRIAEELVLWTSQEFGFVRLADNLTTGSSIMPQKQNPDLAELVRGKTGRLIGDLNALMVTLKGQPLAYNKDMQEDKEPVFDAAATLGGSLAAMIALVQGMRPDAQRMRAACRDGFLNATDLADYLVEKGVPFREAHGIVGAIVAECAKTGCTLEELPLKRMQAHSSKIGKDVYKALDLDTVVKRRTTEGGAAPKRVRQALGRASKELAKDRERLGI